MGFRTVYGNTKSENGWPMIDTASCEWVVVPGTNPPVKLQLATGAPSVIMRAYAADVNAYVEKLRDGDSAGWTLTNSVGTSNHLAGTAMDLDWDDHTFRVSYAGFNQAQIASMREILAFYEGLMFWGQDWDDPKDAMHHQMGYNTFGSPKLADFIQRKIRSDGFSTFKRGETVVAVAAVTEKVLPFNHSQQLVAQEKFFDCCPASCQIVMDGLGVHMSEDDLIRSIGTTTDGTNTVEQALPILNEKIGAGGKYVAQWLPNDPPRPDQIEALWNNIKNSIDANHGCVVNFELSSAHFPRGTRGSYSPQWKGAKVWHYLACMGYADDGPGGRHLGISDPGFPPFDQGVFWMSLEAVANAIVPHAYAYFVPNNPPPAAKPAAPQAPAAVLASNRAGGYKSISPYRTPGEGAIGGLEVFQISDDGMLHGAWVEYSAMVLGDQESIARVVRSAAGHGADTSPAFVKRARRVLSKVPRDDLAAVLARVQIINPDWIESLRSHS